MALTVRHPSPRGIALPAPRLPRLSPRALAAGCAALFALLTLDAMLHSRAFFDLWLIRTVQGLDLPLLTAWFRPVDSLTDAAFAVPVWAALLAASVLARWWVPALAMLTLPAGGVVNHLVGAYLVGRV